MFLNQNMVVIVLIFIMYKCLIMFNLLMNQFNNQDRHSLVDNCNAILFGVSDEVIRKLLSPDDQQNVIVAAPQKCTVCWLVGDISSFLTHLVCTNSHCQLSLIN